MNEQISNLINGYIDETLDTDQLRELENWIRENEDNAQRFAKYLYLHNQLHAEANARAIPFSTTAGSPPVVSQNERTSAFSIALSPLFISAIAALLMIVVATTAFYLAEPENSNARIAAGDKPELASQPFVHIAQLSDAVFNSESVFREDQAIGPSTISLQSGMVRLLFDDGVEVTLQGPAEYTLIGPGQTRLTGGVLAANVPPGAEGFTVKTPAGDVIDLGTAFGIDLDETGNSKVSVFEGEVEVLANQPNLSQRVTEGMTVQLAAGKILPVDFVSDRFDKVWPVSSGIKGSSGDFEFAPAWRPLKMVQSNSTIFVVPEKQGVLLDDPLAVDVDSPGSIKTTSDLSKGEIIAGKRIRSFLLQFNPITNGPPKLSSGSGPGPGRGKPGGIKRPGGRGLGPGIRPGPPMKQSNRKPGFPGMLDRPKPGSIKRISGEITFDQPVLGLIVTEKQLRDSDKLFLRRRRQMPLKRRGLELKDTMIGDVITFSEDRRTVSLSLNAIEQLTDQVRIIVDDSLPKFEKESK